MGRGKKPAMEKIHDRFWLWGHPAGSHNERWNLPGESKIAPVDAARFMGIPNVIMVRYGREAILPTTADAEPFQALDRVVWSVVGAGGSHAAEYEDRVFELADRLPNMTGVMMDDFFKKPESGGDVGVLSLEEIERLRGRLKDRERLLDLWVVLYDHQLGFSVREHLELCDVVTFWTWRAENLDNLERNFAKAEEILPRACRKVLGCYMWDYGAKKPMPVETMEMQCEKGLRWLREGRIEGMIFLASCICDLGVPAVEWTREWIAEMGE
jgi:hypothetical protein